MADFQFPRNPGTQGPHGFLGPDGTNPFAEQSPPVSASGDVFATPVEAGRQSYRPQYERTLPARGTLVFVVGVLGCCIVLVGTLLFLAQVLGQLAFGFGLSIPFYLLGVVPSLAAWIMGRHDLQAMRVGAMNVDDKSFTVWGDRCGIVGTVATAGAVLYLVGTLVWYFIQSS